MSETFPEPYSGVPLTSQAVVVKDDSADLRSYESMYTPGTEELDRQELRVTALGTGYPARRAQGCAGFMVEAGNGDVFIFDAGAGTNSAFNVMRVPYWKATKIFISHFHLDHIGDLPMYYDFGQSNGRLEPLHIYGPDGLDSDETMEDLVAAMRSFAKWHDHSKMGNLDPRGFEITPHRFTADQSHVVYDSGGVTITSFPVPHGIFGAVGFRLDYAGLSVVYAGDCEPSTLTIDASQNADLLIHEIFNPPEMYVERMGWTEMQAKIVAWTKHTSPEAAAKVYSGAQPTMAVGFHAMVAPGTPQPVLDGVRSGYQGPFTLAQDFTVFNVTPDQIVTRQADVKLWDFIVTDNEYAATKGGVKTDPSVMTGLPDWLSDTIIPVDEIEEFKEQLKAMGAR
ncbi:MAG: guanitoxin biosynthesis MBL fold metallo-hydrolase GntH [Acidimicrobiia bacterium]